MKVSEKNLKDLVFGLIVLFIIAFLTGFLQDTIFEFIIYIFYFILFIIGIKLIAFTFKSKLTTAPKVFLLLTGFFSTGYFLSFVFAFIGNLLYGTGITEIMELVEDILYFNSLIFLIGAVGSLVLLKKNARNNHQS